MDAESSNLCFRSIWGVVPKFSVCNPKIFPLGATALLVEEVSLEPCCEYSITVKFSCFLFRRFAVQITSTAVHRATPATCRPKHARRRTTTFSSSPSLRAKCYRPSPETQMKTETYHVTARESFTAPSETHAAGSPPQSGRAARRPGYAHSELVLPQLIFQECGSCDQ